MTPTAGTTGLVELEYPTPLNAEALFHFLRPRAIPGVETVTQSGYRRSVRNDYTVQVISLETRPGAVSVVTPPSPEPWLVARVRHLMDLDADAAVIDTALGADPLLAPLVAKRPGLRVPGTFDGFELAIRAILGQQISVRAASTLAGRLVAEFGEALEVKTGGITHSFPDAERLATADLAQIGMPATRRTTIQTVAAAVASGGVALDGSMPAASAVDALLGLPGIGPWTAGYVAMRALHDPDGFPTGDLGLERAFRNLLPTAAPADLVRRAERWRPWRAYAAMHLWASLKDRTAAQ